MNFKNLLAAEHQKKIFLYWILISGAVGNGASRLIWGFLFSRFGFKILFCVAAAMNISAFVTIMLTNDETVYIIFYTINSIGLGGLMVIFPNVSLIIFGKKMG
jgi:MFS family permease